MEVSEQLACIIGQEIEVDMWETNGCTSAVGAPGWKIYNESTESIDQIKCPKGEHIGATIEQSKFTQKLIKSVVVEGKHKGGFKGILTQIKKHEPECELNNARQEEMENAFLEEVNKAALIMNTNEEEKNQMKLPSKPIAYNKNNGNGEHKAPSSKRIEMDLNTAKPTKFQIHNHELKLMLVDSTLLCEGFKIPGGGNGSLRKNDGEDMKQMWTGERCFKYFGAECIKRTDVETPVKMKGHAHFLYRFHYNTKSNELIGDSTLGSAASILGEYHMGPEDKDVLRCERGNFNMGEDGYTRIKAVSDAQKKFKRQESLTLDMLQLGPKEVLITSKHKHGLTYVQGNDMVCSLIDPGEGYAIQINNRYDIEHYFVGNKSGRFILCDYCASHYYLKKAIPKSTGNIF